MYAKLPPETGMLMMCCFWCVGSLQVLRHTFLLAACQVSWKGSFGVLFLSESNAVWRDGRPRILACECLMHICDNWLCSYSMLSLVTRV
jgi:hypothetical protein